MNIEDIDKTGLIRESYLIEGITASECRSIFLDWALGLPAGIDATQAIGFLVRRYGAGAPDHPMTGVLRSGMTPPEQTGRRGGRKSRLNK